MRRGCLRRQLGKKARRAIILGGLVVVFSTPVLGKLFLGSLLQGKVPPLLPLLVATAVWGFCVWVTGWGIWRLATMSSHPDLMALARYGPPDQVEAAIEKELTEQEPTRLGAEIASFRMTSGEGELEGRQVLLTPSWLVCISGEEGAHLEFQHLPDVVGISRFGGLVAITDDQGHLVEISGTDAGVSRLMAELVARSPGALSRFDERMEQEQREQIDQIVAALRQERVSEENHRFQGNTEE